MRIPGAVALALLSSVADAASFKHDPVRYQRMLQRVESGVYPADDQARRLKNNKGNSGAGAGATSSSNGNGNGNGNGKKEDGDASGKGKPEASSKGKRARADGGLKAHGKDSDGASHSAHMDTNDFGLEPVPEGKVEYAYGESVSLTIDIDNDVVDEEIRTGLDLSDVGSWTIGVYMRMADANSNDPIVEAVPTIACAGGEERKLQDVATADEGQEEEEPTQGSDLDSETEEGPDELEPVDVECTGTATITDTSKESLDRNLYGDGFDAYVTDAEGMKIAGPMTFYMLQSQEDLDAEAEAEASVPDSPRAKYIKGKGKGSRGGQDGDVGPSAKGKKNPSNAGLGSGMDGEAVVSVEAEFDEDEYVLDVDREDAIYDAGDVVTVTYALPSIAEEERRRRRLQGNSGGNRNENSNGSGNGKKDDEEGEGAAPAEPELDATTQAPPESGSPDMEEEEEEESEATTTVPPPDMGAEDPSDEVGAETADEDETIDNADLTLYKIAVYPRMAHPQGGALAPLYSEPFCSDDPCTKTLDELEAGTFSIDTSVLDTQANGHGFDVWIVNGSGGGMAGPVTFYIRPEDE